MNIIISTLLAHSDVFHFMNKFDGFYFMNKMKKVNNADIDSNFFIEITEYIMDIITTTLNVIPVK